jgi:hypothetical protein
MKAKVIRGKGARGVCSYVLNCGKKAKTGKEAEWIGGNMCTEDLDGLVREFSITKRMRPEITKPYYHLPLSCPEGEKLSAKKWDKIAKFYLQKMGVDTNTHQYFVVRHSDTKKDHVHIVTSRIGLDGSVVHGKNDVFTAINTTHEIEKKFKLTPTPTLTTSRPKKKKLTSAEIEKANRTGEAPARAVLQNTIDDIFNNCGKLSCREFFELMQDAGVYIRPNIAKKTNNMNGLAFECQGVYFKGSQLGSDYAWKDLIKRGIEYDENRDSVFLRRQQNEFKKINKEVAQKIKALNKQNNEIVLLNKAYKNLCMMTEKTLLKLKTRSFMNTCIAVAVSAVLASVITAMVVILYLKSRGL